MLYICIFLKVLLSEFTLTHTKENSKILSLEDTLTTMNIYWGGGVTVGSPQSGLSGLGRYGVKLRSKL